MSKNRTKGMRRAAQKYRDEHAVQQKHRCAYCLCRMVSKKIKPGEKVPGNYRTAEHIIPINTFGKNVFYNILAVCSNCNQTKDCYPPTFRQILNIIRVKKFMTLRIVYELLKMVSEEGNLYEISNKIWKIQKPQSRGSTMPREQFA